MAFCELCGTIVDTTETVKVAGTLVSACSKCKKLGASVNREEEPISKIMYKKKNTNEIQEVVPNYSSLLNSGLSKKGINLHQLAMVLNIKESSLNKYFSGKIQPNLEMARKLQNYLGIKLIETVEESQINQNDFIAEKEEPKSLGDMLIQELEKKRK